MVLGPFLFLFMLPIVIREAVRTFGALSLAHTFYMLASSLDG